jgi:hypothetical protein
VTRGIFQAELPDVGDGGALKNSSIYKAGEHDQKLDFAPSEKATENLPQVDVVDKSFEEKKRALVDPNTSQEAKLSYAMQLAEAGMTDFHVKDSSGQDRHLQIQAPTRGEEGAVKISEHSSGTQSPMLSGRIAADDSLSVDHQYLQAPPTNLSETQRYEWNANRINALDSLERLRAKQKDRAYYAQQDASRNASESRNNSFSPGGGGGRTGGGGFSLSDNLGPRSGGGSGDWPRVPSMRLDMPQAGHGPQGAELSNGMISFSNLRGCRVDTDGSGAWRHTEDPCRQSQTSMKVNGRSLDTDRDSFVALPPSVREQYGIKVGDKGFLIRQDTQQAVPVVFGDVSPEKHWNRGEPEASCAALRGLGFNDVSGVNGVDKNVKFQLVLEPDSKHKSNEEMLASLNQVARPNTGLA